MRSLFERPPGAHARVQVLELHRRNRRVALGGGLLVLLLLLLSTTMSSAQGPWECPPNWNDQWKDKASAPYHCSANYRLNGDGSSIGGDPLRNTDARSASANYAVNNSSVPVAGQLVYQDFLDLEAEARKLLTRSTKFRKDISPYQTSANSFDELVRKFDTSSGYNAPYDYEGVGEVKTLQQAVDQAVTRDLVAARDMYAFLEVYAPKARMRVELAKQGLCGATTSLEQPNPPAATGSWEVKDPVRDWCDFHTRLRESVREAANIRMIFGQQFMVDGLGAYFSATLTGTDDYVRKEIAKFQAAKQQFEWAEEEINSAMKAVIGNGCVVSDFYTDVEWGLLGRAADAQIDAQYQIASRQSYLGIKAEADVAVAQAKSQDALRLGTIEGYAKLVRMDALANGTGIKKCGDGVPPNAQFAADIAASLVEARVAAKNLVEGRNLFGFDVTWTPARPYLVATQSESWGLLPEAEAAAERAEKDENKAKLDARVFDEQQANLMTALKDLYLELDIQISDAIGCSSNFENGAEFFACAAKLKQELLACQQYVAYELFPPEEPLPGVVTFEQCINRKNPDGSALFISADALQALIDLRGLFLEYQNIKTKAENINTRIGLSKDRSEIVKKWLGVSGVAQTAADVSGSIMSTLIASNDGVFGLKGPAVAAAGAVDATLKAVAGALSTAADIEMEKADTTKEIRNMLLDQTELYLDASVVANAAQAKRVEFEGIIGHTDDIIEQSKRARAYAANSPGNDPAYRMMRDANRLKAAASVREAAVKAYLAARRAEYEYGARLSRSSLLISDIYRARTAGDVTAFLARLKGTNLLAQGANPADLNTISVSRHVLGLTDEALGREGFTTPQTAEAERVRRFREWVKQNTIAGNPATNKDDVLKFKLSTSLLRGGLFARVAPTTYDDWWLLKLSGLGSPSPANNGLGVNLNTTQTGLGHRTVTVSQAGMAHLKTAAGCIFDYRLVEPAFMLDLEWAKNQDPEKRTATFSANVNLGRPWTVNNRTGEFAGRPVSATDWEVLVKAEDPLGGSNHMDLQQLTDVELYMSVTYANRQAGPPKDPCARIDF